MKLTGKQYEQFSQALRDAFPVTRLRQMLRYRLEKHLDDITLAPDYESVVFDVIAAAEAEGWLMTLMAAARESNPGNPSLLAFAQQFGLTPIGTPTRPELERIIIQTNTFLDVDRWRACLGAIEGQVCRIEIGSQGFGTGFLVGPDVVMTNYHVVEPIINGQAGLQASDALLRFDYRVLPGSTVVNPGTVYHLAANEWLIDSSPPSDYDGLPDPKTDLPQPDELDYALLRLAGGAGSDPVGSKAEPGAQARGWIEVPTQAYDFVPDSAIFIVQHPQAAPLKLALDTRAVIACNANGTRVTYRTNTEPGSSGSPVFNSMWQLIALHHGSDPALTPAYNEGIPTAAIMHLLETRGLSGAIGEQKL